MSRLKETNHIYIIAEIGGNFTNFEQAKRLIDEASNCNVDAVKLQTYKADTLSSKKAIFDMENTGVTGQYELFEKYSIGEDLHRQVFDYARSRGLDVFSSPSHRTDVDMLEKLDCDAYKIGSDDGANIPLLKYIASKNKPVIYATGMCTLEEVKEAVEAMKSTGNEDIYVLHAITAYPTHAEDVNLLAMQTMAREFPELKVGYSDHTLGITACLCAAAMGAQVLEKHFTYDKNAEGPDHMHSADPAEMKALVDAVREFEIMKGSGIKEPARAEAVTRKNNRKSLVVCEDIKAGELFTQKNIDVKRPGYGIAPKYYEDILGKTAAKDLKKEDILQWEDVNNG